MDQNRLNAVTQYVRYLDPAPHAKDRLRFMVAVDGSDIAVLLHLSTQI